MENLMCLMMVLLGCGWMLELAALAILLRRLVKKEEKQPAAELPEEREARKAAAEAQRLYEQGFVNLMRYDGSPGGKERDWQ